MVRSGLFWVTDFRLPGEFGELKRIKTIMIRMPKNITRFFDPISLQKDCIPVFAVRAILFIDGLPFQGLNDYFHHSNSEWLHQAKKMNKISKNY